MFDFQIDDPAGRAALLTLIAAAAWKIWLKVRADHRGDRQGVLDRQSLETASEIYDGLIKQLRDEVNRLATTVTSLSEALDEEREARIAAEHKANELMDRVRILETQLQSFQGGASE